MHGAMNQYCVGYAHGYVRGYYIPRSRVCFIVALVDRRSLFVHGGLERICAHEAVD